MGGMSSWTAAGARAAYLSLRLGPPARHLATATKLMAATAARVKKGFVAVVLRTALAASGAKLLRFTGELAHLSRQLRRRVADPLRPESCQRLPGSQLLPFRCPFDAPLS